MIQIPLTLCPGSMRKWRDAETLSPSVASSTDFHEMDGENANNHSNIIQIHTHIYNYIYKYIIPYIYIDISKLLAIDGL